MPPQSALPSTFDLAVIGAGLTGLAHAYMAARAGKRVVVLDRETSGPEASITGYGISMVTGQPRAVGWRARRSRDLLVEAANQAGITIEQRGLMTLALRPEGLDLLEAFAATEMGEGCQLLSPDAARKRLPVLKRDTLQGALWSPHELRLDARHFCSAFGRWLAEAKDVVFQRGVHVRSVFPSRIDTSAGPVRADAVVVCPGNELLALFPHRLANYRVTRRRLQMLRLAPGRRIRLTSPVQTDLGLLSLPGFAELPEARNLGIRLTAELGERAASSTRFMAVQTADRTIVAGEGRMTAPSPEPFAPAEAEADILGELDRVLDLPARLPVERWTATHTVADRPLIVDRPADGVRLVMLTGGFGASTAFSVAEDVIADLFGSGRQELPQSGSIAPE